MVYGLGLEKATESDPGLDVAANKYLFTIYNKLVNQIKSSSDNQSIVG